MTRSLGDGKPVLLDRGRRVLPRTGSVDRIAGRDRVPLQPTLHPR